MFHIKTCLSFSRKIKRSRRSIEAKCKRTNEGFCIKCMKLIMNTDTFQVIFQYLRLVLTDEI